MSVEKREESRFAAEPINLFRFQHGPHQDDFYGYTDFETDLFVDGLMYKAVPLSRGEVDSTGSLDRTALDITLPSREDIAQLFTGYPPSNVVNLTIMQGHADDLDREFIQIWDGRVLSAAHRGIEATLTCEPISTAMRHVGLRRHYQYMCPHVLYGGQCRADKSNATTRYTVTAAQGRRIELPVLVINRDRFIGGLAEYHVNGRVIIRSITAVDLFPETGKTGVTLGGAADGLVAGNEILLTWGCAHTTTACIEWHANIRNFGGQPFIPLKNPTGTSSPFQS